MQFQIPSCLPVPRNLGNGPNEECQYRKHRVLCVGNSLCHDDGVAFAVADELRKLHLEVSIIEAAEFGLACLDAFTSATRVVVVDAIAPAGTPGTCRVWKDPATIPQGTCSVGHAISLSAMVDLVRTLEPESAPRVSLVGVEAEDLSPFGTTLTPAVRAAVPTAVELVCRELASELNTCLDIARD